MSADDATTGSTGQERIRTRTWYLPESGDLDDCHVLPPQPITATARRNMAHLMGAVRGASTAGGDASGFRIDTELPSGERVVARGQRVTTTETTYHVLREIPRAMPSLNDGVWQYPKGVRRLLLHPSLSRGGLVLLSGPGGSGKTTTITATLVNRLQAFGGVAFTVEDPPEYHTNGTHGEGVCFQFDTTEDDSDFTPYIHTALRGYPAGMDGSILMLGEIRSAEVAALAIESGLSGHLVLTTIHGLSVESALARLISLAAQRRSKETACRDLAECFRLAIHQRLVREADQRVRPEFVVLSGGHDAAVTAKLRQGSITSLANEVERQNIQLRRTGHIGAVKR